MKGQRRFSFGEDVGLTGSGLTTETGWQQKKLLRVQVARSRKSKRPGDLGFLAFRDVPHSGVSFLFHLNPVKR